MKLSEWLAETGLTQKQFAERIGVTQGAVSMMCRDKPRLSLDVAVKIERATRGAVPVEEWPHFRILTKRITYGNDHVTPQEAAE